MIMIDVNCGQVESDINELFQRQQAKDPTYVRPNPQTSDGYAQLWIAIKKKANKDAKNGIERDPVSEFLSDRRLLLGQVVNMHQAVVDLWYYLCNSKDRPTRFLC